MNRTHAVKIDMTIFVGIVFSVGVWFLLWIFNEELWSMMLWIMDTTDAFNRRH